MCHILKKNAVLFFLFFACTISYAQTEFPKEFIAHVHLHSGMITSNNNTPDIFVGGIDLVPQWTIITNKLRGGFVVGGFYAYKEIDGLFGPTLSWKIKEFQGGHFGSLGNLHINFNHLWGTDKQHLAGAGINLDLLNKVIVSLSAQRDYKFDNWWIQSGIAFRISKIKKPIESFPN